MPDERINKILDWLADRITKVEGFVLEQAPDVVQQIVTMDCVTAIIYASVATAAILALWIGVVVLWRSSQKWDAETMIMTRIAALMIAAVVSVPLVAK